MALQKYQERLTGYLRCKITIEWIKRGKPGELEDFVKAVCKAKNLTYVPPRPKT